MHRKLLFVIGGILVLAVVSGGAVLGRNLTAQPTSNDFTHLDNQRRILDDSQLAYSHMLEDYSVAISNAYREERSAAEKQAIQEEIDAQLDRDNEINADRLARMESSLALKNTKVKEAFSSFETQYNTFISYQGDLFRVTANVTRAIGGPCSSLSKLNVAIASYPEDYVDTSTRCLSMIDRAKQNSSGLTAKLLGSIEGMIRERKDKFQEALNTSGTKRTLAVTEGLAMQLEVNGLIAKYQQTYKTDMKKEQDELLAKVNAANTGLEKAIKDAKEGR